MLTSKNGENQSENSSNEGKDDLVDAAAVNISLCHHVGRVGDAEEAAEPASEDRVEEEEHEELVVSETDSVTHPRAEMVHLQNAGA